MTQSRQEPDADANEEYASSRSVWRVVLLGLVIPPMVGLVLWPFRGPAALERGLAAVVFITVPVTLVGGLGLYARRAAFRAAAAAAYGFMAAAFVLAELSGGGWAQDATRVPLWGAAAGAAAAGVVSLLRRRDGDNDRGDAA